MRKRPDLREVAAEIVRRSGGGNIIHLSDPPTASEQLLLLAARLQRLPVAIVPVRCATIEEWESRYCPRGQPKSPTFGP